MTGKLTPEGLFLAAVFQQAMDDLDSRVPKHRATAAYFLVSDRALTLASMIGWPIDAYVETVVAALDEEFGDELPMIEPEPLGRLPYRPRSHKAGEVLAREREVLR